VGVRRAFRTWILVSIVGSIGCGTDSVTESGPSCVPVNVAGVWDVRWVDDGGGQTPCSSATRVWTIDQNGCDVTIRSEEWDPANGATGFARDGRLYVEWTWYEGCHGVRETVDAAVGGDTMTGAFYRSVWRVTYPDCPAGGVCSAPLSGTRRTTGLGDSGSGILSPPR